ncbi:MAG TPA: acetyl-CoA carboxylase carboxyltransferase subunit beta [Candidatus Dormibacteraeota bacterium]|nr:acetyl-CoA carboxylase carboxyltransferase subunit beta [Candidatus Dormibacteraeota bacterium]
MIGGPRAGSLPVPGPRLQATTSPDAVACAGCGRRIVGERHERALRVCAGCGRHARVPATLRAYQIADRGSLSMLDIRVADRDPLHFDDGVPYPQRVASARRESGADEVFAVGRAQVGEVPAMLACMEFAFLGGSLGSAAGEVFAQACEIAVDERRALIVVCTSGGARMQEGIASLAQMARCSVGVSMVSGAGLPYVSVLADPCFGGVTASFATQADVIVAEPGARIGFAGGRVIEQATHDRLPDGFQTAEFLLAHGMVDMVVDRRALRSVLVRLLSAYGAACG